MQPRKLKEFHPKFIFEQDGYWAISFNKIKNNVYVIVPSLYEDGQNIQYYRLLATKIASRMLESVVVICDYNLQADGTIHRAGLASSFTKNIELFYKNVMNPAYTPKNITYISHCFGNETVISLLSHHSSQIRIDNYIAIEPYSANISYSLEGFVDAKYSNLLLPHGIQPHYMNVFKNKTTIYLKQYGKVWCTETTTNDEEYINELLLNYRFGYDIGLIHYAFGALNKEEDGTYVWRHVEGNDKKILYHSKIFNSVFNELTNLLGKNQCGSRMRIQGLNQVPFFNKKY